MIVFFSTILNRIGYLYRSCISRSRTHFRIDIFRFWTTSTITVVTHFFFSREDWRIYTRYSCLFIVNVMRCDAMRCNGNWHRMYKFFEEYTSSKSILYVIVCHHPKFQHTHQMKVSECKQSSKYSAIMCTFDDVLCISDVHPRHSFGLFLSRIVRKKFTLIFMAWNYLYTLMSVWSTPSSLWVATSLNIYKAFFEHETKSQKTNRLLFFCTDFGMYFSWCEKAAFLYSLEPFWHILPWLIFR